MYESITLGNEKMRTATTVYHDSYAFGKREFFSLPEAGLSFARIEHHGCLPKLHQGEAV